MCSLLFFSVDLMWIWLLLLSFVAGVLTVLAPCVLPILPVIVWWSVVNGKKSRPWLIIVAFALSVFIFTLILQVFFEQFGLRQDTVAKISAGILIVFGLFLLFPSLWKWLMSVTKIDAATSKAQQTDASGVRGDIVLWATLWPVMNSCSPTYTILLATVIPASFVRGMVNIVAYIVWLSLMLWLIAYGWRSFVKKMKWAANPHWWFKKIIALLLIFIWIAMFLWWDKDVEAFVLEKWWVIDTTGWELNQVDSLEDS